MTDKFYIYVYRNPLKGGEAFYVGKGFDGRMYDHVKPSIRAADKNLHKVRTLALIEKHGIPPIIDVVAENLTELDAFDIEIQTIAMYGRSDLKQGTLTNLTDGGEGLSGLIRNMSGENNPNYGKRGEDSHMWGFKHSEETRQFMSESQKGKVFSEEHKAAMRKPKSEAGRAAIALAHKNSTYSPSAETRAKLSVAGKGKPSKLKGRPLSDEHRANISKSGKGRPSHRKGKKLQLSAEASEHLRVLLVERNAAIVTCPHCYKEGKYVAMIRWHMSNCKEKKNVD